MNTTKESIHGHEVLQMMMQSGKSYTSQSLLTEIKGRFGDQAYFHTCSAEKMTAAGLIDFLVKKGKFAAKDHGFTVAADKICKD